MRMPKPARKTPAVPSMNLLEEQERKRVLERGEIPNDMGLLPDTFIMPFGKNMPSWFGNYSGRMRLERKRLRTRRTELSGMIAYKYYIKPRPRLNRSTIPDVAMELHETMYTHFAAGNLDALEPKLCPGLLGSLRTRVLQRPKNTYIQWTLHKHLSPSKLVSYKAVVMPGPKEQTRYQKNGLVQAVVRIHSLQSLQHFKNVSTRKAGQTVTRTVPVDSLGKEISAAQAQEEGSEKNAKELVEYFVVQKVLRRSKEGPWMVWGTAEETTLEKLEQQEPQKK